MKKTILFRDEIEKRASLSCKKVELREAFNFKTGDFSALIQSLIRQEPGREISHIEKLQDMMNGKQYKQFCDLIKSDRISQIKQDIHEIRAFSLQRELKRARKEELSCLFSSLTFDSTPLLDCILKQAEIVDSLQDTMCQANHDTLIDRLGSEQLIEIKRNLWNIKKLKNSSDLLDKKIKQYKSTLEEIFEEISVDTSHLLVTILEREREEDVVLNMPLKVYNKLQKIFESEPFMQTKKNIQLEYDREHRFLELSRKRQELTKQFQRFRINFKSLIENIIQGQETADALAGFQSKMSFRLFNQLSAFVSKQSTTPSSRLSPSNSQLNSFELQKIKELTELLRQFQIDQAQNFINQILTQSLGAEILQFLSQKLICSKFHRLQAIINSQEVTSIKKKYKDQKKTEGNNQTSKAKQLSQMFESFDFHSQQLVEAILSESPGLEAEVLDRLSEQMSAKKYSKLVQQLGAEEMENYYTSSRKNKKLTKHFREFDEKVEIISKILMSKKIQPSLMGKLTQKIIHKLKELPLTLEAAADLNCPQFTFIPCQGEMEILQTNQALKLKCSHLQLKIQQLKNINSQQFEEKLVLISQYQKLSLLKKQLDKNIAETYKRNMELLSQNAELKRNCEKISKSNDQYKGEKQKQEKQLHERSQFDQKRSKLLKQAKELHQRGKSEYLKGNFSQALNYYDQCRQKQIQAVGQGMVTAQAIYGMGQMYYLLKQYSKSIESYKAFVNIYETHDMVENLYMIALNTLGKCFRESKEFESGAQYFKTRLRFNQQIPYQQGSHKCAWQLARNLADLGWNEEAENLKRQYDLQL